MTSRTVVRIRFVEVPIPQLCGLELYIDMSSLREITIGRHPDNIVVIPDPTVSRRHAVIVKAEGRLLLRDLGSKNGTYILNGSEMTKVSEIILPEVALVKLGHYTLLEIAYCRT